MRQGGASGPRNIGDSQLTAKSVAFENAVYHSDLSFPVDHLRIDGCVADLVS